MKELDKIVAKMKQVEKYIEVGNYIIILKMDENKCNKSCVSNSPTPMLQWLATGKLEEYFQLKFEK